MRYFECLICVRYFECLDTGLLILTVQDLFLVYVHSITKPNSNKESPFSEALNVCLYLTIIHEIAHPGFCYQIRNLVMNGGISGFHLEIVLRDIIITKKYKVNAQV